MQLMYPLMFMTSKRNFLTQPKKYVTLLFCRSPSVYFPTSIMSTARAEATRRRVSAVSASARAAWASPPSLCSVDLIGQAILMNGFNGLK